MLGGLPPIAPPDAPSAPGWWPLPPGWWFVALGLFMLLMWGFSHMRDYRRLIRRRRKSLPDVRLLALAALDELQARGPMSDRQMAYRINEILRAALFASGPSDEWSCFTPCPEVVPVQAEWEAFWEELAMRYRRPDEACDSERQRHWLQLTRGWIEQLPEQEQDEMGMP